MSCKKTPRSRAYLAWIRTQPCVSTGRTIGVQAAHVRIGQGGGMGLKPSDFRTLPLHSDEHRLQHCQGERTYWQALEKDPDVLIMEHLIRYIGDPKSVVVILEEALKAGMAVNPREARDDGL